MNQRELDAYCIIKCKIFSHTLWPWLEFETLGVKCLVSNKDFLS